VLTKRSSLLQKFMNAVTRPGLRQHICGSAYRSNISRRCREFRDQLKKVAGFGYMAEPVVMRNKYNAIV
jgi:hypothetical protein